MEAGPDDGGWHGDVLYCYYTRILGLLINNTIYAIYLFAQLQQKWSFIHHHPRPHTLRTPTRPFLSHLQAIVPDGV